MKSRIVNFIPLIVALPSVFIGVVAMYYNEVSASIWAQNIAYLLIVGLISYFVVSSKLSVKGSRFHDITMLISLLFIVLTFINPGMEGVHRWISIGILRFNVSMIVLPIVVISLWELLQTKSLWVIITITIAVSILLAVQPDASQLTGFAIPMMIMLCNKADKKVIRLFIVGTLSTLIILSWVFLDNLPAVDYVEGIVGLLANMGSVWLALGITSLIILPVPFILLSPKNLRLPSICLGLYFAVVLTSTLFGTFPVMLMGYGGSPIIGYFIAMTWYARSKSFGDSEVEELTKRHGDEDKPESRDD